MILLRHSIKLAALAATIIVFNSAHAIVPGVITTDYPFVGRSGDANSLFASGVSVGDRWFLVPRHIVAGQGQGAVRFYLPDKGTVYSSVAVWTHPTDDIALVRVDQDLPGWYGMRFTVDEVGQVATIVGYGDTGVFQNDIWTYQYSRERRLGMNKLSAAQFLNVGNGIQGNFLYGDFDGPTKDQLGEGGPVAGESTLGQGDSGAGIFLTGANGVPEVAGIGSWVGSASGGPQPPQYGSLWGAIRLSSYKAWIQSLMPIEARFTSVAAIRGTVVSGGLTESWFPDDARLIVRNGAVALPSESPITVQLEGTARKDNPSVLRFVLEGSVSVPNLTQRIALYNWSTAAYDVIDTRSGSTVENVADIQIGTQVARYINSSTGVIRARILYKPAGALFTNNWQARIDRASVELF